MSLLKRGLDRGTVARILSKLPIFTGLSPDEYLELVRVCNVARCPAGTVLFRENDSGADLFVVLSGSVVIETYAVGRLGELGPGEFFGEIAILCPMRRTATATVRKEAALLRLSRDNLDALLGRSPRISYLIMRNVAQTLAQRLVSANERLGGKGPWEV